MAPPPQPARAPEELACSGQSWPSHLPDAWRQTGARPRQGELAAEGSAFRGGRRGITPGLRQAGGWSGWLSRQPARPELRAKVPRGGRVIQTICLLPALLLGRPGARTDRRRPFGPWSLAPTWPGPEPTGGWGCPGSCAQASGQCGGVEPSLGSETIHAWQPRPVSVPARDRRAGLVGGQSPCPDPLRVGPAGLAPKQPHWAVGKDFSLPAALG